MNRLAKFGLGLVAAIGLVGIAIAPIVLAADSSETSVTGNLEDAYCYGTMGAKGPGHKQCAIKCASAGNSGDSHRKRHREVLHPVAQQGCVSASASVIRTWKMR